MRLFTLCACGQAIELWDRVWYHTRNEADDHPAEPKVPFIDHVPKGMGTTSYWPAPVGREVLNRKAKK